MPEKIKLQLFPIDEATLVGLEKDGYYPYLELTLSARKKVSSVLKHLNDKWGSSKIASGEPVLYPYNVAEGLARRKWTLSDIDITAGEVYATIGNPSVFRLRYGCSLNLKLNPLDYLQRQLPTRPVYNLSSCRKLAVLIQRVLVVK